jgi:hypothetical protein
MQLTNPAIRIRTSQVEPLGNTLARCFYDDPGVTYILPDPHVRRIVLPWFFTSVAIRTSRLCGEIYTTANVDGGALWLRPGVESTIGQAAMSERLSMPFRLDRLSITRWISVNRYLEAARRDLADKSHWQLVALATERSKNGISSRGLLVAPVLAAADWNLQPCYVATFNQLELPFYEECGFRIAGAGKIPNSGPSFWALIRTPNRHFPMRALPNSTRAPQPVQ